MTFYKETNLQETQIGKIPQDWKSVLINQISEVRRGASPRPIGDPKYFSDKGRGWVRISDVTETYKYLRKTSQYLSELGESKSVKVNPGDLIMSICATIGRPILVDMEACIHDGFVVFRNLSKEMDTEFLFYVLQKYESKFAGMRQTGTQGNLNTNLVGNTLIPLPSLSEQRGIVGVLGVVDSVIAKTGEVIAKTERLKKGLMQRLLTRGIGHKEYKQTPIGTIPKTWQVTTTSDVTLFIKDGTHTPPRRVENGIPLFSAQNIVDGKIVRTNEDTYITEEEYWKIHTKYEIQKNDVLLTIVGTIGNTAIVDVDYRFTLQRSVAIFRPDTEKIEPRFLHYAFQSDSFKRQLLGHSKLTTQGGVYLKELSSLMIPVPPFEEQHKITNILSSIDAKLELEKKEKVRLERIKHGLMDLLLTGKIRVKVD
jgi:type I restriction enzyme S subunit